MYRSDSPVLVGANPTGTIRIPVDDAAHQCCRSCGDRSRHPDSGTDWTDFGPYIAVCQDWVVWGIYHVLHLFLGNRRAFGGGEPAAGYSLYRVQCGAMSAGGMGWKTIGTKPASSVKRNPSVACLESMTEGFLLHIREKKKFNPKANRVLDGFRP